MWILKMALAMGLLGGEPIPGPEAIQKAEKQIEEVFGKELAKAQTRQAKIKLAQEMLRLAREDKDQANQYVLAQYAKQLAIQAQDRELALQAVEIRAKFCWEESGDPPMGLIKLLHANGNDWWKKAEKASGMERLRCQMEAAEFYLRALDGLKGLERAIAEQRLKELGWSKYVFAFEFEKDTEGWVPVQHIASLHIRDGALCGRFTDVDPFLERHNLKISGSNCPIVEIRLAITDGEYIELFWSNTHPPRWVEGWKIFVPIKADGQYHIYRIDLSRFATWTQNTITALRLDPGDHFQVKSGRFQIDYIRGVRH